MRVVLVALACILAGCMQGPSSPQNDTTPVDPEPEVNQTTPEETLLPIIETRGRPVWLNTTHGADHIRIHESASQNANNQERSCYEFPDKPPLWTLLVWNQTGLADFQYRYHPRNEPMDWNVSLPSDPPYLFFVVQPCIPYITYELPVDLNATTAMDTWGKPDANGRSLDPLIVVKDITHEIELVFPPGALEAEAVFPKSPYHVHMDSGLIPGHVTTEGQPFGDIWEYDPIAEGDDDWKTHVRNDELDSYWEANRLESGQAGDYVFKARMDVPWPNVTTWRVELDVYEINPPELAKLGFNEELRYWL